MLRKTKNPRYMAAVHSESSRSDNNLAEFLTHPATPVEMTFFAGIFGAAWAVVSTLYEELWAPPSKVEGPWPAQSKAEGPAQSKAEGPVPSNAEGYKKPEDRKQK